jgi:hypothetical protein
MARIDHELFELQRSQLLWLKGLPHATQGERARQRPKKSIAAFAKLVEIVEEGIQSRLEKGEIPPEQDRRQSFFGLRLSPGGRVRESGPSRPSSVLRLGGV